jgi:hypothetical protein
MPHLVDELVAGTLVVRTTPVPLSSVEDVWNATSSDAKRVVFVPSG